MKAKNNPSFKNLDNQKNPPKTKELLSSIEQNVRKIIHAIISLADSANEIGNIEQKVQKVIYEIMPIANSIDGVEQKVQEIIKQEMQKIKDAIALLIATANEDCNIGSESRFNLTEGQLWLRNSWLELFHNQSIREHMLF